jgi:hypothetical protein
MGGGILGSLAGAVVGAIGTFHSLSRHSERNTDFSLGANALEHKHKAKKEEKIQGSQYGGSLYPGSDSGSHHGKHHHHHRHHSRSRSRSCGLDGDSD